MCDCLAHSVDCSIGGIKGQFTGVRVSLSLSLSLSSLSSLLSSLNSLSPSINQKKGFQIPGNKEQQHLPPPLSIFTSRQTHKQTNAQTDTHTHDLYLRLSWKGWTHIGWISLASSAMVPTLVWQQGGVERHPSPLIPISKTAIHIINRIIVDLLSVNLKCISGWLGFCFICWPC